MYGGYSTRAHTPYMSDTHAIHVRHIRHLLSSRTLTANDRAAIYCVFTFLEIRMRLGSATSDIGLSSATHDDRERSSRLIMVLAHGHEFNEGVRTAPPCGSRTPLTALTPSSAVSDREVSSVLSLTVYSFTEKGPCPVWSCLVRGHRPLCEVEPVSPELMKMRLHDTRAKNGVLRMGQGGPGQAIGGRRACSLA